MCIFSTHGYWTITYCCKLECTREERRICGFLKILLSLVALKSPPFQVLLFQKKKKEKEVRAEKPWGERKLHALGWGLS